MRQQTRGFGRISLVVAVVMASMAMGTFIGRTLARPLAPTLKRSNTMTYKENKRFQIDISKDTGTFSAEDKIKNVVCKYTGSDGKTEFWTLKKMKLDKDKEILTLIFDTKKPPKKDPNLVDDDETGTIEISLTDDDLPFETGDIPVEEVDVDPCG